MDGTEVLVHLINGVPLCRERERGKHSWVSHMFACIQVFHMQQIIQLLSIFPTWLSVPVCLPNHIGRLLALTSNETCDDSCHTGSSHVSVAGVWYAIFESLWRRTLWFSRWLVVISNLIISILYDFVGQKVEIVFCMRLNIYLLIHFPMFLYPKKKKNNNLFLKFPWTQLNWDSCWF